MEYLHLYYKYKHTYRKYNKIHVNSIIMVAYEGRKEMGQIKGKKVPSSAPVFDFFLKERKR